MVSVIPALLASQIMYMQSIPEDKWPSREERDMELARRLGYAYTQTHDAARPLSEYILPVAPFTVVWPFVIIRELVLDDQGMQTTGRDNKAIVARKVRLIPRGGRRR
jgi:hypothetical protein